MLLSRYASVICCHLNVLYAIVLTFIPSQEDDTPLETHSEDAATEVCVQEPDVVVQVISSHMLFIKVISK